MKLDDYIIIFVSIQLMCMFHDYVRRNVGYPPPGKKNNLSAVSRFEGIEAYYQRMRPREFGQPPEEPAIIKIRIIERKTVCKSILSSYYFKMRGEEYLDVDDQAVRNELRTNYSHIYYSLYKRIRNRTGPEALGDGYEYNNDYELRSVSVLGRVQPEYVIMCLARGSRSRIIRTYFVTQPYNVNIVQRSNINIFGRFIFARPSNHSLRLVAMAEESAYQYEFLRQSRIIHVAHFTYMRQKQQIARVPQEDPVCNLSAANKLRLCTSLFGAAIFKKKGYKFIPSPKNVLGNCVRRRIVLVEPIFSAIPLLERLGQAISKRLRPYEEWTIGCKASTLEGERIVFHVSNGGDAHEILVYTKFRVPGYVVLYSAFNNVSVVDQVRSYSGEPRQSVIFPDVED